MNCCCCRETCPVEIEKNEKRTYLCPDSLLSYYCDKLRAKDLVKDQIDKESRA